jgi:hypothetical protein
LLWRFHMTPDPEAVLVMAMTSVEDPGTPEALSKV